MMEAFRVFFFGQLIVFFRKTGRKESRRFRELPKKNKSLETCVETFTIKTSYFLVTLESKILTISPTSPGTL